MKKFILPLACFALILFFPKAAFASVNLTATDGSTSSDSTKTATLSADTGTDSLKELDFDVQASSTVTISKATVTEGTCDTFAYTITGKVLNIKCTFNTATKVKGTIATITFTSTSDTYTFTILNNDNLNIGGLTLGTITNLTATAVATTSTNTTATTTSTTTSSLTDKIMNYLPYVLIGGAAILLISIVGILLSKKKDSSKSVVTPVTEQPVTTPEAVVPEQATVAPINMDNISNTLYSPSVDKPSIQETLQSENTFPVEAQPTYTETNVQVPTNEQSSDLQDILKGEISAEPMTPVTNQATDGSANQVQPITSMGINTVPTESTTMSSFDSTPIPSTQEPISISSNQFVPDLQQFMNTPATPSITPSTQENVTLDQPLPNLQQFINTQVDNTPLVSTTTPLVQPTETTPVTPTTPVEI